MKHELGQYFTTNKELKNKVLEFVLNKPENYFRTFSWSG